MRLEAVIAAVSAVLISRSLSAAQLGRALPGTSAKHAIKRFDRLLGNAHFFEELPRFFAAIARAAVKTARPVILVDWTQLRGPIHALVASVAFEGRSIILFATTHHAAKLGNTAVQLRFLEQLKDILPPDCRPIVVSDAGFHGDFFRKILCLGWDFVGRIRGTAAITCDGEKTDKQSLYARATKHAKDFPTALLYAVQPITCRLVLIRKPRTARRSKPTRNKELLEYRKSARDPWLLATSLDVTDFAALRVVDVYARRMQIEESFRDVKSARFGLNLQHARSRSLPRLSAQLCLAALALFVAIRVGKSAEAAGLQRQLQANTRRTGRVLSLVRLGLELFRLAADAVHRPPLSHLLRGDP